MTSNLANIVAKMERLLQPTPVKVNGNVIEQMPALVGPIKRKDLEALLEAVKEAKP